MIPPDQGISGDLSPLPFGEDDLIAQKIQAAMLPRRFPSFEGVELGFVTLPGRRPGGDLFDIQKISEDVFALVMFEVACSGMRSILISAMAKVSFSAHLFQNVPPASIIERVNEDLSGNVPLDLRLSAFVGYFDLHDNLLTFCNAGNIVPLVYRNNDRTLEFLQTGTRMIEPIISGHGEWDEECVQLLLGDCLVLYTNGVRQLVKSGEQEPEATTRLLHQQLQQGGCEAIFSHVRMVADGWKEPCEDDLSVVGVEVLTQSRKNQIKEKLGFAHEDIIYLQFLNYLEEMDQVTATILSAMDVIGYPDERIRKMKIVLTELLVNAIIHGNGRNASKRVVVGHIIDRKKLVISILDEGNGFDPSGVPDPTLPENLEKPCGRGLFIVRHYVDSITFNETGNRVMVTTTGAIQV